MKKIMILGGGPNQIPLINAAKKNGYYVIVCDYDETALGVALSDEFCLVSIMDKDGVLQAARKRKVDGIISNSEPAMPIVAYVGNQLNLPSNNYETIAAMINKYDFRTLLKKRGFTVPRFSAASSLEEARTVFLLLSKPVMIKPEASSGSRGVKKLTELSELNHVFDVALAFSRTNRVIMEEYIDNSCGHIIGGDVFVSNNKVIFWGLMSCIRDQISAPLVPIGEMYPPVITHVQEQKIKRELSEVLSSLGYSFGAVNVEIIIDANGNVFFVELNPRNGGNMIPEELYLATGFDIFDATVRSAVGETIEFSYELKCEPYLTYIVHANQKGVLRDVQFSDEIRPFIESYLPDLNPGDPVEPFVNAEKRIGILILHFQSVEQRDVFAENIQTHICVELD